MNTNTTEIVAPRMLTIRQTARVTGFPEYRLRAMHHQGILPGVAAGSRYYVNFDVFLEQIDTVSRKQGEAMQ